MENLTKQTLRAKNSKTSNHRPKNIAKTVKPETQLLVPRAGSPRNLKPRSLIMLSLKKAYVRLWDPNYTNHKLNTCNNRNNHRNNYYLLFLFPFTNSHPFQKPKVYDWCVATIIQLKVKSVTHSIPEILMLQAGSHSTWRF